ncbi:response regulator transcription factor [Geopseudomonas guangdongensis]|uniref:DNA-binding response regulator, OmpR family, contains REC and winged-helix (WHTH) domain n=1 Tax=Geopseudomonas guangdongensis TaxID=1245526 RepID=A0A1H2GX39_9GAMM|nr:response regulator transcription factor [Pseudomonas guangdongensis]SDU24079.1 DNA-binding response regulator, OmpR family, contains REC and winged-helix (wHTH) domain [Pseudomonas guangdongensis]
MVARHTPIVNPATPLRVLVVEDHLALREVTVEALCSHGYRAQGVDSAEAVYELPSGSHFDIALVDLNLPGEDGLSLTARLRHIQPGIGIVILSARHSLDARLAGYRQGADLYLNKPTAPAELCAAIDALARRLTPPAPACTTDFVLERAGALLHTPDGMLSLRPLEAEALYALALAPEHFLESWQLLERLGKPLDIYGKAQLEVLISRLRGRLRAHGSQSNPIRAERGKGYRLNLALQVR